MMTSTFSEARAKQAILQIYGPRLDRAAMFIIAGVKQSFGNAPPQPKKSGKGFRKNSTKRWRSTHTSAAWGPPNVVTGHLRRNVGYDSPSRLVRRIGTGVGNKQNVGYAMYLEFGTKRMLPRPFLRPAMRAAMPYVSAILGGKL